MNELANTLQTFTFTFRAYLALTLSIIAILWLVQCVNKLTGYRLNILGITPRTIFGVIGIPLSPFLHRDFTHLLFNSLPLFLLMNLVLLHGYSSFIATSIFITLFAGVLIWLLGRRAIHIGSSIVIMGYFGYLLANAYQNRTIGNILLVLIALYYFGGLLLALVPGKKGVSWEGHIFGFIAGIGAAYVLPQIMFNL